MPLRLLILLSLAYAIPVGAGVEPPTIYADFELKEQGFYRGLPNYTFRLFFDYHYPVPAIPVNRFESFLTVPPFGGFSGGWTHQIYPN